MNDNVVGSDREWLDRLGHDLRGPVGPIVTGLSLLRAGGVSPDKWPPLLDLLQRQVEQLLELIDDAAALGRLSDPARNEPHKRAALADLLDELVERVSYGLGRSGMKVEVAQGSENMDIECDERQLLRVLAYVVTRVAHWAGQGGIVSIGALRRDGNATVVVRGLGSAAQAPPLLDDALYGVVGDARDGSLSAILVRRLAQRHRLHIETPQSHDSARQVLIVLPAADPP